MKLKLNMFFFYRILSCFSRNLYVFYGVCFTDRVALLLLGDVLVDVLVAPVKHELLLLPVVHPHDLFGHLLDDLLQLLQLLSPTKWHFLARQKKEVGFITWPTIWHKQRWADNIFVFIYLQTVPFLVQSMKVSFVSFLNLHEENWFTERLSKCDLKNTEKHKALLNTNTLHLIS